MQDGIHLYLLCGLAGVVAHILLKYQTLRDDAAAANVHIDFKMYIKKDFVGMLLSVLAVFIWHLIFGEVAEKYKDLHSYIRISFVAVGLGGAYGLQKIDNNCKKYIRKFIDEKTNIADKLTGNEPHQE